MLAACRCVDEVLVHMTLAGLRPTNVICNGASENISWMKQYGQQDLDLLLHSGAW